MTLPNQPVTMVRAHLDEIPRYNLPPGFALRWYRPGDEDVWRAIQAAADRYNDITPSLFDEVFGDARQALPQRQCYLLDAHGEPVGTATAWYHPEDPACGRLHWVAVRPAFQGRGLARPLLTAVCGRMRALGHARAYLTTSAARYPAIRLYHRFGFRPEIHTPAEAEVWQRLQAWLDAGYRV